MISALCPAAAADCPSYCHVLTLVPFVCFYFMLVRAWVGVGILCFLLVFIFLCVWPGMVRNQKQLSIVVPDWEPYLGSLVSLLSCGNCFGFVISRCRLLFCSVFIILIKQYGHLPCCALVFPSFLLLLLRRGFVTYSARAALYWSGRV